MPKVSATLSVLTPKVLATISNVTRTVTCVIGQIADSSGASLTDSNSQNITDQ